MTVHIVTNCKNNQILGVFSSWKKAQNYIAKNDEFGEFQIISAGVA